jgi:hypothetical protein
MTCTCPTADDRMDWPHEADCALMVRSMLAQAESLLGQWLSATRAGAIVEQPRDRTGEWIDRFHEAAGWPVDCGVASCPFRGVPHVGHAPDAALREAAQAVVDSEVTIVSVTDYNRGTDPSEAEGFPVTYVSGSALAALRAALTREETPE